MPTPIPFGRSATYVRQQTATQTSYANSMAITDAMRVVSADWDLAHDVVKRRGHDAPHEGGLKNLAGPRRTRVAIEVERTPPTTAGDVSTWQQHALWAAVPLVIDTTSGKIVIGPTAGRVPFVHYTPIELATYTPGGSRRALYNGTAAYLGHRAEPGGIIIDRFEVEGVYVDTAASTVNDVAEVSTLTIDTYADGEWVVTIKNDLGDSSSVTYDADSETASNVATGLTALIDALDFVGAGAAAEVVTVTGAVGRPLTITVTPPGAGAATVAETTTALNFAEAPTYQSDNTPVVYFGATIVHQIGGNDVLNVGAIELQTGMQLSSKKVGDAAAGYGYARIPRVDEAMLVLEFDEVAHSSFAVDDALRDATELAFSFTLGDAKLTCPQLTYEGLDRAERAGDVGIKATCHLHGSGSASDMWSIQI